MCVCCMWRVLLVCPNVVCKCRQGVLQSHLSYSPPPPSVVCLVVVVVGLVVVVSVMLCALVPLLDSCLGVVLVHMALVSTACLFSVLCFAAADVAIGLTGALCTAGGPVLLQGVPVGVGPPSASVLLLLWVRILGKSECQGMVSQLYSGYLV